jgi:hypothetical protein
MPLLEKKEKNRFLLNLHKDIYPKSILAKAIKEDKSWVRKKKTRSPYEIIEFKTTDMTDVLNWANYLLYLRKKSQNA